MLIDTHVHGVLYVFKFQRVMAVWIALYLVDKVYQERYVTRVFVREEAAPSLVPLMLTALLVEGVITGIALAVAVALFVIHKRKDNTFIFDAHMLTALAVDYLASSLLLGGLGALLGAAVQDGRLFRYKRDDGLRGIRALCTLLLYVSAVVLSIPYYHLVLF